MSRAEINLIVILFHLIALNNNQDRFSIFHHKVTSDRYAYLLYG